MGLAGGLTHINIIGIAYHGHHHVIGGYLLELDGYNAFS